MRNKLIHHVVMNTLSRAASIRGRLLNGVRCLFDEIRYTMIFINLLAENIFDTKLYQFGGGPARMKPQFLKNESSCLVALYHGVHLCPDNTDEYWHLLCRGNVICAKVWCEKFLK